MGLQSRSETSFRPQGEAMGTGQAEALDLLREVAALLLLAQERAREGKSEKKPGEGKWYTSTPRWGGGAGGEVGNLTGNNSDDDAAAKKDEKRAESKPKSRRASAAEAYRKLLPGMGTWDPKITYVAIGKDDDREVDDVSLVLPLPFSPDILFRKSDLYQSTTGFSHLLDQPPRIHSPPPRSSSLHLLPRNRQAATSREYRQHQQ